MSKKWMAALGCFVLALALGVSAEEASPAVDATAAVAQVAASPAAEGTAVDIAVLFQEIARAERMAGCPVGTCNKTLDCFQQHYPWTCPFGTARFCDGASNNGSCDGACTCN